MQKSLEYKNQLTQNEYVILKYIISYFDGKISYDDVYNKIENVNIGEILDKLEINLNEYSEITTDYDTEIDIDKLKPYKNLIKEKIKDYEIGLNLSNVDRGYNILYDWV